MKQLLQTRLVLCHTCQSEHPETMPQTLSRSWRQGHAIRPLFSMLLQPLELDERGWDAARSQHVASPY
jgi:hypothetical protein